MTQAIDQITLRLDKLEHKVNVLESHMRAITTTLAAASEVLEAIVLDGHPYEEAAIEPDVSPQGPWVPDVAGRDLEGRKVPSPR